MSTSAPKRYYHRHFQFTADQTKQSSSSAPSLWHRLSNRFNSRLPLATLCLLGAGILVYLGFFQQPQALTGPIDDNTPIHEQFSFLLEPINPFAGQVAGAQTTDKMVLGFLPYWEVGAAQLQPELTDLAYFGITIGSDGSFVRTQSNGEPDIGTTRADSAPVARLKQQLRLSNTQYHLVFKQFNNDDIQTFLSTPAARDRFIDAVDRELRTGSIQGINMDIEYSGENAGGLQEPYTNLLSELDTLLKTKYPDVILSIDMYASGAENDQIWHVERMAPFVDYIVVMAYDFHRRGSVQSGPVAPIFGDGEKWNGDINSSLADFLAQAPNEKLLLGVPFYGYGWQTTDTTAPSNTFPGPASSCSRPSPKPAPRR